MAMSPELKAKLAAAKAARRGTLLKDIAPDALLVACDHAEEQGLCVAPIVTNPKECVYLRYATGEQAKALMGRLAHKPVLVNAPRERSGMRPVLVYDRMTLVHVLRFAGVDANKYLRRLDTIYYVYDLPRTAGEDDR